MFVSDELGEWRELAWLGTSSNLNSRKSERIRVWVFEDITKKTWTDEETYE